MSLIFLKYNGLKRVSTLRPCLFLNPYSACHNVSGKTLGATMCANITNHSKLIQVEIFLKLTTLTLIGKGARRTREKIYEQEIIIRNALILTACIYYSVYCTVYIYGAGE